MSKGQLTKERIIAEAARVFNSRGFTGASVYDIMDAVKLKKGGIYRHFNSKDELALAAFDFAYNRLRRRYKEEVFRPRHAATRLEAILNIHGSLLDDPYLEGGCPILNTAVESVDTHPDLRAKAQWAMDEWRNTVWMVIRKGIERRELKEVDAERFSTVMIASLEGAVMLAKLYDDKVHIRRVIDYLKEDIRALSSAPQEAKG